MAVTATVCSKWALGLPSAVLATHSPSICTSGRPAFTILTTGANATVAPVHDRMPVMLDREAGGAWLAAPRLDLLRPAAVERLVGRSVSPRANAVENDDPGLLEPFDEPPEPQLKLF